MELKQLVHARATSKVDETDEHTRNRREPISKRIVYAFNVKGTVDVIKKRGSWSHQAQGPYVEIQFMYADMQHCWEAKMLPRRIGSSTSSKGEILHVRLHSHGGQRACPLLLISDLLLGQVRSGDFGPSRGTLGMRPRVMRDERSTRDGKYP